MPDDSQHLNMSTHTNMSMASTNISIKQEAYDYLKSIKTEEESFSDAILKLKKEQRKNGKLLVNIARKYKKPNEEHIKEREEAIQQFRKEFERIKR